MHRQSLSECLAVIAYARRMRRRQRCPGVAWDTYYHAGRSAEDAARNALDALGGLLSEW